MTNPPIDPLREGAVMSLTMFLGPKGDVLEGNVQQAGTRIKIDSPVINAAELRDIEAMPGVKVRVSVRVRGWVGECTHSRERRAILCPIG